MKMNDTLPTLDRRRARALFGDDTGAATAEYAITTMATVMGSTHTHENRSQPPTGSSRALLASGSPQQ
jgi:hypothetical protein